MKFLNSFYKQNREMLGERAAIPPPPVFSATVSINLQYVLNISLSHLQ